MIQLMTMTATEEHQTEQAIAELQRQMVPVRGIGGGVGVSSLVSALNETDDTSELWFADSPAGALSSITTHARIVVTRPTSAGIDAAYKMAAVDPVTLWAVVIAPSPERLTRAHRLVLHALGGVAPVVVLPWVSRFDSRGPNRSYRRAVAHLHQLTQTTNTESNEQ